MTVTFALLAAALLGLSNGQLAQAVTEKEHHALLVAEWKESQLEPEPFTRPEFDDSAWQTTSLPPDSDAPNPWPDGANGTIWYRRAFPPMQESSRPSFFNDMFIRLSETDRGSRVYLNGTRASTVRTCMEGWLLYSPRPAVLQPETNILAIAVPVSAGQGGFPAGNPDELYIHMSLGMHVTAQVCDYEPTEEWHIPLAGEWKCHFVPATDTPPEGGAE